MRVWVDQINPGVGLLAAGFLLLRIGQAAYAIGLCRAKNSASASVRSVCDLCVAVLAFWAVGAAILFQNQNPIWGFDPRLAFGAAADFHGLAGAVLVGSIAASIATGVVVAAAGERSTFFALLAASVLLAAFVVPVTGNWASTGWLARLGFSDPAGASWIHLAGGVCAAVAAWAIGPRQGKYNRDGSVNMIPGHSIPLSSLGALLMLAGWLPCIAAMSQPNAGSSASPESASLNVLLGAAAAGLASLLYSQFRYGKPDVGQTIMGLVGGLVAITAVAGVVASCWAVVIGAVAGLLVPAASIWIDRRARIDDPAGAIAIHGVGGLWGTLAAGIFAGGTLSHRAGHLSVQALGAAAIAAVSAAASLALFLALRATVRLRATELDEFDGIDLAQHDVAAYPDFQQNTIRSYHTREA